VGATPLAVTNCLNFANPQRPEIMAQLTGCLDGMGDACRALDFPIVSGNVSLYNESKATGGGSAILPTPAIGGIGLLADWSKSATVAFKHGGDIVWLIGGDTGHLGQSLWLREIAGEEAGPAPTVDLAAERKIGELVRQLISDHTINAVHDVSDGGVLTALAEMALAGNRGAVVASDVASVAQLFGEDQGRYLVAASGANADEVEAALVKAGVDYRTIASVDGDRIQVAGRNLALADLRRAHEGFFPTLMGADAALA
jgi:phosphoribosylformylglycinamidine synthase